MSQVHLKKRLKIAVLFDFFGFKCVATFSSWRGRRVIRWTFRAPSSPGAALLWASTWGARGCTLVKCSSNTPTQRRTWTSPATDVAWRSAATRAATLWPSPYPTCEPTTRTATIASLWWPTRLLRTNTCLERQSFSSWLIPVSDLLYVQTLATEGLI